MGRQWDAAPEEETERDEGPPRTQLGSESSENIQRLVETLLQTAKHNHNFDEEAHSLDDHKVSSKVQAQGGVEDLPIEERRLQIIGAETFRAFEKRVNQLDNVFRDFSNGAHQLGSAARILSCVLRLRECLAEIMVLYRENAINLFPNEVILRDSYTSKVPAGGLARTTKGQYQRKRKVLRNFVGPEEFEDVSLRVDDFPARFDAFAEGIDRFMGCLKDFTEFEDESLALSIVAFRVDLNYWATCLRDYTGQFDEPGVQRYMHDLTGPIGEHIEMISTTLSTFTKVGLPAIRFSQHRNSTNLVSLSTVATFFSGVTATTLQFSQERSPDDTLATVVNCFWFASLVFSIAAAVNSLVGATWIQSLFRSPGHRIPWWVHMWIKNSPLGFLVMAAASFSVGFCVFAYASHQHRATSTITTVLTSFSALGLLVVTSWFALERLIFKKFQGEKWLEDARAGDFISASVLKRIWKRRKSVSEEPSEGTEKKEDLQRILDAATELGRQHIGRYLRIGSHARHRSQRDIEANGIQLTSPKLAGSSHTTSSGSNGNTNCPIRNIPLRSTSSSYNIGNTTNGYFYDGTVPLASSLAPDPDLKKSTPRLRWKKAIRYAIMQAYVTRTGGQVQKTVLGSRDGRRKTRIRRLTAKIKSLETTTKLVAHESYVSDVEFSPNGKYLASASSDLTSKIFDVSGSTITHRTLGHYSEGSEQVAWSPNGQLLLTKLHTSVKIWTEDGVFKKTVKRTKHVESVTWWPDGQSFLSVEEVVIYRINLDGEEIAQYDFGPLITIWSNIIVLPGRESLMFVGLRLKTQDNLEPSRYRVLLYEKQMIVYNTRTNFVEHTTPLVHDVREIHIAPTRDADQLAVLAGAHDSAPQLWIVRDQIVDLVDPPVLNGSCDKKETRVMKTQRKITVELRHLYLPQESASNSVFIAGPVSFGGKDNELVLGVGKSRDIYIWDRESATFLRRIPAHLNGNMMSIAWNSATESTMFATGSAHGSVRIWTKPKHVPA